MNPDVDPYARLRELPLGSHVAIRTKQGGRLEGWILPPDPLSSPRTVRLKVASGYNVGLEIAEDTQVEVLPGPTWGEERKPVEVGPTPSHGKRGGRPAKVPPGTVSVLTTGGTIASRIDYTTGGVHPIREPDDPEALYPGITSGGPLEVKGVLEILSEDMTPHDWELLAHEVVSEFHRGAAGVVVAQGTDTLAYSAAGLAYLLRDLPGPVVLVGAQRSIDRPSSDGVANLRGAVRVAREADLGEVVVVMHAGPSDDVLAVHRGTRVRKMHSTRRDAFRTLNGPTLGRLGAEGVRLGPTARRRAVGPARVEGRFSETASLLWFRPGLSPERAESEVGAARGLVLAGTGMGHVASSHLPWIQRATGRGVVVGMTTQCLEGEVDPFVYSRGRELLQAGVSFLGDISPECAYVKLMWALGASEDPTVVRRVLLDDVAGEFGDRRELERPEEPPPGQGAP
jgi:glutamyl-tRNA(Gln) amidotransferase subunit D